MVFPDSKHIQTNLIGNFDLFDSAPQAVRRSYAAAKLSMPICICVSPQLLIIGWFVP
jgi:hypothetical protein